MHYKFDNHSVHSEERSSGEEIEDLDESNSFEKQNNLFELTSERNALAIQLNKMKIAYESNLHQKQAYISQLQGQNQKLEIEKRQILEEKQFFKAEYENLKKKAQFEGNENLGDSSQELRKKNELISLLQEKLKKSEAKLITQSHQEQNKIVLNKLKELSQENQEFRRKQLNVKKQYEEMLLAKEQLIKKMTENNEQHMQKMLLGKDKIIEELRKQVTELINRNEGNKKQVKLLTQRTLAAESDANRIINECKKKEDKLFQQWEMEKLQMGKGMNDNIRRFLDEKQERIQLLEGNKMELEKQIISYKQENGILKSEVNSLKQFNEYLQSANKDYEQLKIKLHKEISEKQLTMADLRQEHIVEIHELKKGFSIEKKSYYEKISALDEEILTKSFQIEKLSKKEGVLEKERRQMRLVEEIDDEKQRVIMQNERLKIQLENMKIRYNQKSEALINTQNKLKSEYSHIIEGLEEEVQKLRREQQNERENYILQTVTKNSNLQEEYAKIKKLYEMVSTENQEKEYKERRLQSELKELRNKNDVIEKEKNKLKEEFKSLEEQYEEVSTKTRKVYYLESKITQLNEELEQERKRFEKRRNQYEEYEEKQANQIMKQKSKIRQLQDKMEEEKYKSKQNKSNLQQKIDHLTSLNRQKEYPTIEKQKYFSLEKEKTQSYIVKLEEQNENLNRKISRFEGRQKKEDSSFAEKEFIQLKIQYSQCLRQLNVILQKYKKLQETHEITLMRASKAESEYDKINEKYVEIYKEKMKIGEDLKVANEQVKSLNYILISKEEGYKSKVHVCPHYEGKNPTNMKKNEKKDDIKYFSQRGTYFKSQYQ